MLSTFPGSPSRQSVAGQHLIHVLCQGAAAKALPASILSMCFAKARPPSLTGGASVGFTRATSAPQHFYIAHSSTRATSAPQHFYIAHSSTRASAPQRFYIAHSSTRASAPQRFYIAHSSTLGARLPSSGPKDMTAPAVRSSRPLLRLGTGA
jgi:hypothetical protein